MPTSPPLSRSAVVTRLRAAGCVFAEDEAQLLMAAAGTPAELAAMVERRAAGLPLEHVLGWAEFCGLRIAVDPGVFVPRPRTEFLVRTAVALASPPAVVVDLCCGSGAVGVALAAALGGVELHAVDIDPAAVRCARRNVEPAGGRVHEGDLFEPLPAALASPPAVVVDLCCGSGAVGVALAAALRAVELHAADIDPAAVRCARRNVEPAGGRVHEGDLFEPLPAALRGRVDVLAANVPYVPTGAIELLPPEARLHEPRVALDGGADGLDVQRRVAAAAPLWLAPGGSLLVETSEDQAPQAAETFARHGLSPRVAYSEELEATVVVGSLPAGG